MALRKSSAALSAVASVSFAPSTALFMPATAPFASSSTPLSFSLAVWKFFVVALRLATLVWRLLEHLGFEHLRGSRGQSCR